MRLAYLGLGVWMLACVLGCHRAPLAGTTAIDAGGTPSFDARGGPPIEAGLDVAADLAADVPDAAADVPPAPPVPCGALRALAAMGPFTTRHAIKALFTADRRLVIVNAIETNTIGGVAAPVLLLVPLPAGQPQILMSGVKDAEWFGNTGTLLVTLVTGDLAVVPIDGSPPRTIAHGSCAHLAAADGSRVFSKRDCATTGYIAGALDEIDVATGVATPRAPSMGEFAMSPSGRFVAYVTASAPDAGVPTGGIIHVLDGGSDEELSQTTAYTPYFVSDRVMLFVANDGSPGIFVHVPGTGSASRRIGQQNRGFGYDHYRVSPDGALVLGTPYLIPTPVVGNKLFAIGIDDGTERVLTNDIYPYQLNQLGLTPFMFTPDGRHVVYLGANATDVFAVRPDATGYVELGKGFAFTASAFADRVATIEGALTSGPSTLHVVSATTGDETQSVASPSFIRSPTFVPGDRGVVYVESAADAGVSWNLSHLSFVDGRKTVVAQWQRSNMPLGVYPAGDLSPGYPVDPTGCFTIVDSDLADSNGTSLVVLPDAPE